MGGASGWMHTPLTTFCAARENARLIAAAAVTKNGGGARTAHAQINKELRKTRVTAPPPPPGKLEVGHRL